MRKIFWRLKSLWIQASLVHWVKKQVYAMRKPYGNYAETLSFHIVYARIPSLKLKFTLYLNRLPAQIPNGLLKHNLVTSTKFPQLKLENN